MALFKDWQDFADQKSAQPDAQQFWAGYFLREKDFYAELLKSEPVSGTVQALAERFNVELVEMTGFLDGINESLKTALDLEGLTAETEVSLDYDPEKLYYNMVAAKAEWLYTLPEWEPILTEEKRRELYKAQKSSTTVVKGPKVGRNDPCPCGSGKKYKKCCGALALRHFEAENSMLRRTAARLSAKPAGVLEAVIHREAQLADLQAALRQKNAQIAALYAERLLAESTACAGFRLVAAVLPGEIDLCRAAAESLCAAGDVLAVLLSAEGTRFRYVCMAGARCPADCRTAAKRLRESLGAKGGGSEKAAQGSFEYGGAHGALLEKIGEVLADGCLAP